MKRLSVLSLALSSLFTAVSVQADTLPAVIERTLRTNPDVQINVHRRLISDQEYRQARAAYLPSVDLSLGYGEENSDNSTTRATNGGDLSLERSEAAISINQMLFDGFKTSNETARQQARRQASAEQVRDSSENTALKVAEVYLEMLRKRRLLELAKDNLVVHQKTLDQVRLLVESGAGRRADIQQTEARLALATSGMLRAEGELRDGEYAFLRVTGEEPSDLAPPPNEEVAATLYPTLEATLDQAVTHHPALKTAEASLRAAQSAYEGTNSAFMPRFDLELSASRNDNLDGINGRNDDTLAMVRMRYNLYRGGADKARRQAGAEQVEVAREVLNRTRRAVEEETRMAWNSLNTTRQRLIHLRRHVEASEKVMDSYTEQFKLGQRTLLDLLDSKFELYNARTALVSAEYAELFDLYRVLTSTGNLLSSLGLAQLDTAQKPE